MTNEAFLLLSEGEKNTKFRAVLKRQTANSLNEEEVRSILMCVSLNRQYSLSVYREENEFNCILTVANGFTGQTILGQALVGNAENPGKLFDSGKPAAVITRSNSEKRGTDQLHIYIPKSRLRKGNNNEQ